jgi:hypothetical protein
MGLAIETTEVSDEAKSSCERVPRRRRMRVVGRAVLFLVAGLGHAAFADTGLNFPSNGDAPADAFVAFQFDNPQNNGLPLWGPSGQGATYMWKYRPRQQNGYYVTFWWSQADGFFSAENGYYGGHPYPNDGVSLPPLRDVGTHNWEIAIIGQDIQQTRSGQNKRVVKDVWYTQALKVVRTSANSKTLIFYTALPSTAPGDVIEYTVTSPGYGETTPPTPKITFGDSPWYDGGYQHERLSGVLRGIKIFNRALSEAAILSEAASDSLASAEGQANIWYMNINPTPADISDKSGKGHNPSWATSDRATLWSSSTTTPGAPQDLSVN